MLKTIMLSGCGWALKTQVVWCEGSEHLALRRLRGLRDNWRMIENNSQAVLVVHYSFLETFRRTRQEALDVFCQRM
jgi:hypothetical protein